MFVLYLDAYFLGDPLFLTGLARDLAARQASGGDGLLIVHGVGEAGARAVEATGADASFRDGTLTIPPEAAGLVERAGRDLNRQIVHELSEAGVHAMRVTGVDRGLVRADGSVGKVAWLAHLAAQRALPVVLAIAPDASGGVRNVAPAALARDIAAALGADAVIALSSTAIGSPEVSLDEARAAVPDANALSRMASGDIDVIVAVRASLRSSGRPAGAVVLG